jgi:hypothetical protein
VLNFRCLETCPGKDGMQDISHNQTGIIDISKDVQIFLMLKYDTVGSPGTFSLLFYCVTEHTYSHKFFPSHPKVENISSPSESRFVVLDKGT